MENYKSYKADKYQKHHKIRKDSPTLSEIWQLFVCFFCDNDF